MTVSGANVCPFVLLACIRLHWYLTSCSSLLQATVSAVTDKLQQQDVEGAGQTLSAALVTGTVIGCIILVAFQVSSSMVAPCIVLQPAVLAMATS